MIDPQDSETQGIDEVLRPTRIMESGVSTDETRDSHNHYRVMYTETNQTLSTIPGVVLDQPHETVHRPKTVRTLAEFPAKPNTPCIEWQGSRTPLGYGVVGRREGKLLYAHRDAWERANGRRVPAGMMVCHACDNRRCIEPSHLWIGTQADNMGDCKAKGRPRGRRPRFSEDKMRAIAAEPGACTAVAARHGVGKDSILRWRKQFGAA